MTTAAKHRVTIPPYPFEFEWLAGYWPAFGEPGSAGPARYVNDAFSFAIDGVVWFRPGDGKACGVLSYTVAEVPVWKVPAHTLITMVHPSYRRQGVATAMLDVMLSQHGIVMDAQRWTQDGALWADAYETRRGVWS